MMSKKIIYKYPLGPSFQTGGRVEMPFGAKILTLQMQLGPDPADPAGPKKMLPTLWAECPREQFASMSDRYFTIIPTGQEFEDRPGYLMEYIGTFQDGWFVGHVYEMKVMP
jgi:hypothetical protein